MLNIREVHPGTKLIADGGFICLDEGQVCEVYQRSDGALCVRCKGPTDDGVTFPETTDHNLDGQLSDDGEHYIGFTLAG